MRKRKDSDEATLYCCAVNLCPMWNDNKVAIDKKRFSNSYKGYIYRRTVTVFT